MAASSPRRSLMSWLVQDPALVRQSTLFTYVHSDQFCDREEMGKSVTTSANEERNPLVHKMMHDAKNRQQVGGARSTYMYLYIDMLCTHSILEGQWWVNGGTPGMLVSASPNVTFLDTT